MRFKSPRKNASSSAHYTTPLTTHVRRPSFKMALCKCVCVVGTLAGSLYWFGSPSLRVYYTYTGSYEYPSYRYCLYLSLNGWHEVTPFLGMNQCPIIKFVPLKFSYQQRGSL